MTTQKLNNCINKFKLNPSNRNLNVLILALSLYQLKYQLSAPKPVTQTQLQLATINGEKINDYYSDYSTRG